MWLPVWLRDLKNRERPPLWLRALLRAFEEASDPVQRARLGRHIAQIKASRTGQDLAGKVDLAMDGLDGCIAPLQLRAEVIEFLTRVSAQPPRRVIEVGTLRGGMLYLLAQVAAPGARVLSVDLPYRGGGMGYPRWRAPLFHAFGWPDREVHLIQGDSHFPATRAAVRRALGGEPLDLLFIDGDHSYAGVARDFADYGALVREGGIISMDGIEPRGDHSCGTDQFWCDIKSEYPCEEIVEARRNGFGLGLLRRGAGGQAWPPAPARVAGIGDARGED
jgi:predicted O-methyltransferase YrrM